MNYLVITHIIVATILIIVITLQEQGSETSGIFGGGAGGDSFYQTRRGLEKIVFGVTIVCIALFIILAVLNLVLPTL